MAVQPCQCPAAVSVNRERGQCQQGKAPGHRPSPHRSLSKQTPLLGANLWALQGQAVLKEGHLLLSGEEGTPCDAREHLQPGGGFPGACGLSVLRHFLRLCELGWWQFIAHVAKTTQGMGLFLGPAPCPFPQLEHRSTGVSSGRVNAGMAQTWPGVTEDLHENPIEAFSCFNPNSNPEREALPFAWHYFQENCCVRKSSRALHTRNIDHLAAPSFLTALCITPYYSSWAHHSPSRPRSCTNRAPLRESTRFSFLLLTVDQRPNQGKEARGDGSDVGTTREGKEGKEITLNWCWKSSFHKCETVVSRVVYFKVQLSNPKVVLCLFVCLKKNSWYLLPCHFFCNYLY